jgi:hypothetical protein
MAVPEQHQHSSVRPGGSDWGEVGALVLMTLALAGWVAAAFSVGEERMFLFAALAAVLTLAGMAMARPTSAQDPSASTT